MVNMIPNTWLIIGGLPAVDPTEAVEDDRDLFTEDLFQATEPSGRFLLDVGWLPEADLSGTFVCQLVRDGEWDPPVLVYRTKRLAEVHEWLEESVLRMIATI